LRLKKYKWRKRRKRKKTKNNETEYRIRNTGQNVEFDRCIDQIERIEKLYNRLRNSNNVLQNKYNLILRKYHNKNFQNKVSFDIFNRIVDEYNDINSIDYFIDNYSRDNEIETKEITLIEKEEKMKKIIKQKYVYFIAEISTKPDVIKLVKIGSTVDVIRRITELNAGNARPLEIINFFL